ncbi:hypothetical protein B0O99DRAFT_703156 [Bisporella sp. PMI_857]|nr:hypothetical protein B0O99DRAFT_703156 [Bisporella sp. PMI_857]
MDLQAVNNTYLLLKRFRFPTGNTTKDAIAVTSPNGLTLVSLYTLMIQVTISQVWAASVLIGVAFFMRKTHTYNRGAATAGIYNASASQTSVLMLLARYLKPMKHEIWYLILWAVIAVVALAGISAASILIPRLLVIGHAAPVDASTVYFPGGILNNSELENTTTLARAFALTVPYYLRSAGQVGVTARNSVVVEQERNSNPNFVRVNYRYNVTAAEFGLQHAPGLVFYVEGSCYTEYGWLANPTDQTGGDIKDTYNQWGDPSKQVNVSGRYDGGPPFPFFKANYGISNPGIGNVSYSIVVSSLNRPSYTESTDPWYLTEPFNDSKHKFSNKVKAGRPALSCWETNKFHYHGKSVDMYQLNLIGLSGFASPDGKQTPFLTDILQSPFALPLMVNLGTGLGRSALRSASSSALGVAFNAGTSSIFEDLEYLVMASYIATKNLYVESTRFPSRGRDEIPDIARSLTSAATVDNSGPPRSGTGDFVITDPGITTLSVRALIAMPVAMVAAVGAVLLLGLLPSPWRVSNALNATVLYSHLHEREEKETGEDAEWDREGVVAFSPRKGEARLEPVYKERSDGKKAGYYWLPKQGKTERPGPPLVRE